MPEIIIKNPENLDFSKIVKDISMKSDGIVTTLTYPNGFVMCMQERADGVRVTTSKPLILNPDGTYTIPE